jgi:hypothetical protein
MKVVLLGDLPELIPWASELAVIAAINAIANQ